MRCVAILIVWLFASVCSAQVIVSDDVPPPVKYPSKVYMMTDAEYREWATRYNKTQLKKWKKEKSAIKEPEYLNGTETDITGGYSGNLYPWGSGYGSGYFGSGYFGSGYFGSGYFGSGYGLGHGLGYGSSFDGTYSQQTVKFPRRWPNPWHVPPAPVRIVNPYVRPTK